MEKTDKPPVCFWVKLLFGIIKTLIKQRLNDDSLTEKNIEELVELTKKIIDGSKEIKEKTVSSGPSGTSDIVKQRQTDLLKSALKEQKEPLVPKEPPAEFEFIADPPSISAFDLGKF